MKKIILLSIISALFISSQTYATLVPGTTIKDYLPVISGDVLTDTQKGFSYQFRSIDEFEIEGSKYKLKMEKDFKTRAGTIAIKELEFDSDPLITGNTLITNLTNSTQVYTITFTLPTAFLAAPNLIRGSIVVSLLDEAGDGASFSTAAGIPIYSARIDSITVATLLNDPYSLSGLTYVNSGLQEFGWQANGVPVNSSIGIQLQFALTAHDSAAILSRFEVAEIPEPATVLLLGLGTLLIKRRK